MFVIQNPEGIPSSSPGLRGTSYPGECRHHQLNLEEVAPILFTIIPGSSPALKIRSFRPFCPESCRALAAQQPALGEVGSPLSSAYLFSEADGFAAKNMHYRPVNIGCGGSKNHKVPVSIGLWRVYCHVAASVAGPTSIIPNVYGACGAVAGSKGGEKGVAGKIARPARSL